MNQTEFGGYIDGNTRYDAPDSVGNVIGTLENGSI